LREFASMEELDAAHPVGEDPYGHGTDRVPGPLILPHALHLARNGYILKETAHSPGQYEVPDA
jgi:hypothetical protein